MFKEQTIMRTIAPMFFGCCPRCLSKQYRGIDAVITNSKTITGGNMKPRTISITAITVLSGLLLGTAQARRVHADEPAQLGCSNKTLHGTYGFYRTGNTPTGPLAAVGIGFYDGDGNSSSIQSISRNGDFTFDLAASGEYEVAEDCTAKGFRNGVEIVRYVIVDGGNEIYGLSENAGNAVYLVGKKIHKRRKGDN
jgi:hypothetical protein